MHLAVIFENIGGYHAARLRSAQQACTARGWRFTAVQITHAQNEHPWGELDAEITPLAPITVLSRAEARGGLSAAELRASGPAIAAVLDELRPEAVAIPGWGFAYSRAALSWCRAHRAVAILMSESKHDDEPRAPWKEFLKSHLYVRKFESALVGANAHRDYLVQLGLPAARIFTGYDVVDNDYFARTAAAARAQPELARTRQPAIPTRPYFLVVTRLIARKNVALLLEAYARYCAQTSPAWDLVICGSGVEEPALRAQIGQLNLTNKVHLPGFISYRDLGDWYGLAGALVHPARQEQWGLVVNEAMSAGLPVIVSNRCGCYPDLVQAVGFGFDPQSAAELTERLSEVSRDSTDRAALGAAAVQQVQQFSPAQFAEGLISAALCARPVGN